MPKRLNDSREMTEAEADDIFAKIVKDEIALVKIAANYDAKIARLKEEHSKKSQDTVDRLEANAELLKTYILGHQDRFKKPRQRKTKFGKYGMRKVSNVSITNEKAVLDYAKKAHPELIQITTKLVQKAIRAAITAGKDVPGVEIEEGEIASYTAEKKLLDQAKKEILS